MLEEWNKKKIIEGKSVDDIFKINGIPLWWIYHRYIEMNLLPKRFPTLKEKDKRISHLTCYCYRKVILVLEFLKVLMSKKPKETDQMQKVLLLSYTNHINKDNSISRLQKIVGGLRESNIKHFLLFSSPLTDFIIKKQNISTMKLS